MAGKNISHQEEKCLAKVRSILEYCLKQHQTNQNNLLMPKCPSGRILHWTAMTSLGKIWQFYSLSHHFQESRQCIVNALNRKYYYNLYSQHWEKALLRRWTFPVDRPLIGFNRASTALSCFHVSRDYTVCTNWPGILRQQH